MSMLTRQEVFDLINEERAYQDSKWNPLTTTSKGIHSDTEWIAYIEDYLAEAKHFLARNARQNCEFPVGCILRKVAAMTVACLEQNGAPTRAQELESRVAALLK